MMKKTIQILIVLGFLGFSAHAQQGEWTWMNGSDSVNALGHYGTQGVFAPDNSPPSLYEACEWTDKQGNFWLFGGVSISYNPHTSQIGQCENSDLWEFNPSTNEWAWIKGPGTVLQSGIYGVQNVPSPTNNPGARSWGVLTWTDTTGDLWLLGGRGYNGAAVWGVLSDFWKYSIVNNEWTWVRTQQVPTFGIQGIESPQNYPGHREEVSTSWTYYDNSLWFFGGITPSGTENDLWRFNISTNSWTWMKGSDTANAWGVYGTIGIPDTLNTPGARWCYTKWRDKDCNFWLFGGGGYDAFGNYSILNDLWKYDVTTNEWTWMSGTDTINNQGSFNNHCTETSINCPSSRYENRACWSRNCDNFEFFGGSQGANEEKNDIWNFNVNTNKWSWVSGSSANSQVEVYGTRTVSNSNNIIGSRAGGLAWKDIYGNVWIFGGTRNGNQYEFNDMWRYSPDTTCPSFASCSSNFPCSNNATGIPESNTNPPSISLYPNPNNGTFTLHSQLSIPNSQFLVKDVYGRTVYSQTFTTARENETLTLPLSSGIYFWQLLTNETALAQGKLVLMK